MNIKKAIKQRGLTITEVAKRMGVARITLQQHLVGNPTSQTLQRIADAIGCSVHDFYEKNGIIGFVEINGKVFKVQSLTDLERLVQTTKENSEITEDEVMDSAKALGIKDFDLCKWGNDFVFLDLKGDVIGKIAECDKGIVASRFDGSDSIRDYFPNIEESIKFLFKI